MPSDRVTASAYALLRIVFGAMLTLYGLQKLGLLGGKLAALGSWPYGLAGPLEVACGTMIAIGLLGSLAAFIASGEMAVAYFYTHLPNVVLPVQNDGQPAVLLCFGFLLIAAAGSGIWSLDGRRQSTGNRVQEGEQGTERIVLDLPDCLRSSAQVA